ncbi:hypothetical protein CHARACLAT_032176 [Characodon lateralis]|uniref:Major facilitator superfamily (MFS) profile domain-containing protein n=1 Tax=Characodon lateralis TaxID=208331 RepID=A0ABU7CW24_9TELE|nr:hypothetical protein [Characodon lateralis]
MASPIRFIPESPRWLISQNNSSKALEIIKAIAKENGKKLSLNFEILTDDEAESPSASLLDLIRTPNMRKHTFILMFNWFTSAVVYQGLIMRVGITGGNVYIDFLISGLVEFPAAFLILLTIERIGRRLPFASANILAGVSCIVTAFIPDSMFWLKTTVACIGRLGITMAFEMVVFVNTELYPTRVRNLGVSVCSTLCDVGGIVSPFLLYRLATIWLELPLIIFGAFDRPPALMAPFPLSQLRASGRRLKNFSNPPTKRHQGLPAFTLAPAAASPTRPGFCSGSPPISSLKPIFPLSRPQRLLSTLTIPQSSLLHSSRPSILSNAHYHPLLSFSGSSPPILPRQHFLFSVLLTFNPLFGSSH